MFPDSSLTTSFSSPLCFFIRADVLWKLPRLTALWKTWGNFRASSPSVPQVFHRAFEIASRFQRAAWKTLRVSHSSHRTLLLDIYRPQDARNHNLPRPASGHATTILTQGATRRSKVVPRMSGPAAETAHDRFTKRPSMKRNKHSSPLSLGHTALVVASLERREVNHA